MSKNITSIGVDLGGTSVKGGRVGAGGLEQMELSVHLPGNTAEEVFGEICRLIRSLWTGQVGGIGFAVPALIDRNTGSIYGLSNLQQMDGFPILKRLREVFKVPVLLQNDANCFVLGEKMFGGARNYRDVVGLITGTGVGAGLIFNDQLYEGKQFGAGEFGMIPYGDGVFEDYCSGKFFTGFHGKRGEELAALALKGDPGALLAFSEYGTHLGELVKLICYAINPQVIVLGGSVSKSYPLFSEALEEAVRSYYFGEDSLARIIVSSLEDAAILGAASLLLQK